LYKTPTIFISYAKEDKEKAISIYQDLSELGFNLWIDKKNILPGEIWKNSIYRALKESELILILLSSNANKRGFFQTEIGFALEKCQEMLDTDIYLIPVRLENCAVPDKLCNFQWVDYYKSDGRIMLEKAIRTGISQRIHYNKKIKLRSKPKKLREHDVKKMLSQNNYFDRNWYWMGTGLQHEYSQHEHEDSMIILDNTTDLIWQQSGSNNEITFDNAVYYVTYLNNMKYYNKTGWRLPTLEEAMSLVDPSRKNGDLFIDPLFNNQQTWIWTIDTSDDPIPWVISFYDGSCIHYGLRTLNYVRAVNTL